MLHGIRRFCLLLGPVYAIVALLTIHSTVAITFTASSTRLCGVIVEGEILKGDFDAFVDHYNTKNFQSVCLNSPGGSYLRWH